MLRLSSAQRDPRVVLSMVLLADFVAPLAVFSVGALAPLLRDSLALSREQIGSLTAFFFAGAALAGIPVGWGADRFGVRRLLIAAQAVHSLGLLAVLVFHTYVEILAVMFLAGLSRGAVMVLTTKALYEWFPREQRALPWGPSFSRCPSLASWLVPQYRSWRCGSAGSGCLRCWVVWRWRRP